MVDIERIKELLNKSTPGPWTLCDYPEHVSKASEVPGKPWSGYCDSVTGELFDIEGRNEEIGKANGELICLLRNTIESLLDERERHVGALEAITLQEWEENCLDPQWASRVAKQALYPESGKEEGR